MEMKDETRNMDIKFGFSVPYFCLAVKIPVAGIYIPEKDSGKATSRERTHKLEQNERTIRWDNLNAVRQRYSKQLLPSFLFTFNIVVSEK